MWQVSPFEAHELHDSGVLSGQDRRGSGDGGGGGCRRWWYRQQLAGVRAVAVRAAVQHRPPGFCSRGRILEHDAKWTSFAAQLEDDHVAAVHHPCRGRRIPSDGGPSAQPHRRGFRDVPGQTRPTLRRCAFTTPRRSRAKSAPSNGQFKSAASSGRRCRRASPWRPR